MTISDIAKKEIVILGEQKEKAESLIDPIQSKI
jgi:hypothetical protein